MQREMMWVDGVPPETKERLKELAQRRFGKASAALMVRHLIDECLSEEDARPSSSLDLTGDLVRVELRLPKSVFEWLEAQAEKRLSARNYYICSLLYKQLGIEQLQGDEIEVLRRSNYELSKIGTNLNQIAKAFNLIWKANTSGGKPPEIGRKMASLRSEIKEHTSRVLRVLEAKTVAWESKRLPRKKKGKS